MKVMSKIAFFTTSVLTLAGCFGPKLSLTPDQSLTAYTPVNIDELEAKFDNQEDFFVLKALSNCTYCIELKPIINEFVTNEGIEILVITIYVADEIGHPMTTYSEYNRITALLEGDSAPVLYVVDDGEVVTFGGVGGYSLDEFTKTVLRYVAQ